MDKDPRAWDCGAAGGGPQPAHSSPRGKAAAEVPARVRGGEPRCACPCPGHRGCLQPQLRSRASPAGAGLCLCVCACPVGWGVS